MSNIGAMDITIVDRNGWPGMCETGGCLNKATSSWTSTVMAGGVPGTQRFSCDEHNPVRFTAAALPHGFTSKAVCHACGQPVPFTTA